MGRKNISDQRKEEILDAFEICIEKNGLTGSSTRKISEEAGIKQPLISHYFGSKEIMVSALVERIINHYMGRLQTALDSSNDNERIKAFLDYVFDEGLSGNKTKANLIGHLLSAATSDDKLKLKMKEMYSTFLNFGNRELQRSYPLSTVSERKKCSYGILCLIAGNDVVLSVDLPWSNRKHARICAEALINELEKQEI